MSHEKKEMMNRALNAMTINIGKSGVNDNVIEEIKLCHLFVSRYFGNYKQRYNR